MYKNIYIEKYQSLSAQKDKTDSGEAARFAKKESIFKKEVNLWYLYLRVLFDKTKDSIKDSLDDSLRVDRRAGDLKNLFDHLKNGC